MKHPPKHPYNYEDHVCLNNPVRIYLFITDRTNSSLAVIRLQTALTEPQERISSNAHALAHAQINPQPIRHRAAALTAIIRRVGEEMEIVNSGDELVSVTLCQSDGRQQPPINAALPASCSVWHCFNNL